MIEVGDFIMDWNNIYVVREIRDDKWIVCETFKLKIVNGVFEIKTEPILVSIYKKVVRKMMEEGGSRLNKVYPQAIRDFIKYIFEHM